MSARLSTPPDFALDVRLRRDCVLLGSFPVSEVLLMDRAELPWFVLVPHTAETELHRLEAAMQAQVLHEITALSKMIELGFEVDKLNVAAIGNVVPQLHIHVVGRYRDDPWWPGVVWGTISSQRYGGPRVRAISRLVARHLGDAFIPAPT